MIPAMPRPLLSGALRAPGATAPRLSIVSTMYCSREFLERFFAECLAAVQAVGCDNFEIVMVNDGSPDDSLAYALERRRDIAQLVVVDLSRNFGHHSAMQAGLRHARGERIFLIDCDLEVAPGSLAAFHFKLEGSGADLVFGYQEARKGGWFERFSGGLFWKGINLLSDVRIPENITGTDQARGNAEAGVTCCPDLIPLAGGRTLATAGRCANALIWRGQVLGAKTAG